ncbi:hypothetical protein [Variovorax rhizosphaerae]|uniref:Uncharacterized protein n=1 Tax=Variovorax rhizosphaerae TaxID=1836200 RepID=A0ABU8WHW8_9BURK
MSTLSEDEVAYLTEMRALGTDARGDRVLVGLTEEETDFYVNHGRRRVAGDRDHSPENKRRYLELFEKHERVRLAIIGGEVQLRTENPARH